ncbi:MAG: dockerin type I repeat-containing protein [Oscillospiraceae bacterium]|nr:dockerin type I repeat-containing protein [Oscillospiraceae bacterium]
MPKIRKTVALLLIAFTIAGSVPAGAVSAPSVPGVDYIPGQVIVRIKDDAYVSVEELQNPSALFPGVDILSIRDLLASVYKDNPPSTLKLLLLELAADSYGAMKKAIDVLKDNPLVEYVDINILVKIIDKEPFDPSTFPIVYTKESNGVELKVSMAKTQYVIGDKVRISATVKNNTDSTITITAPDPGGRFFKIETLNIDSSKERLLDTSGYISQLAVIVRKTLEPGAEFSQTFTFETWNTSLEPATPGMYNVNVSLWYTNDPIVAQFEIKAQEDIPTRQIVKNSFIYGDFTGNGIVDGTDILWIQRYCASGNDIAAMLRNFPTTITTFCEEAADFTNNGDIDGNDVLWISRFIVSNENASKMLQNFPTAIDFSHLAN